VFRTVYDKGGKTVRLLVVGADIIPPWTEGRKKLVRDLTVRMHETFDVHLITTGSKNVPTESPYPRYEQKAAFQCFRLHALHRALNDMITAWPPDMVLHFPFGTFHGFRRIVNEWSIRYVDRLCFSKGIRCLTVFYSITDRPRERMRHLVREPVLNPAQDWSGWSIPMGTDLSNAFCIAPKSRREPTVLFMAGLQETKSTVLRHILEERGLADIVKAAPGLGKARVRIVVAIPLLRDARLAEELRRCFLDICPEIKLELRSQISIPQIFEEADLYLFPYRRELTQFIPTSVLEAMAAGIPVVISDLAMLSSLSSEGQTAYVFHACDAGHLEEVILSALSDPAGRQKMATLARDYVIKHWSIEHTVAGLTRIIEEKF
jgi:glycosyltransferase involved in cell wall biosynthesis